MIGRCAKCDRSEETGAGEWFHDRRSWFWYPVARERLIRVYYPWDCVRTQAQAAYAFDAGREWEPTYGGRAPPLRPEEKERADAVIQYPAPRGSPLAS